jgi:hypothetical protein
MFSVRLGLVSGLLPSAGLQGAAPVAAEPEAWQPLFNGRDLQGWTVKCKPADRARTFWKVEDGAIVADSMDAGQHDYVWLVSDLEYADFVLRLRFQTLRDNPGNGGAQMRSRYDDAPGWLDGPQVDIHPPGPGRTGIVWDETRGNQRWRGAVTSSRLSEPSI